MSRPTWPNLARRLWMRWSWSTVLCRGARLKSTRTRRSRRLFCQGIPNYAKSPEDYSRGMVRSIFVQPHPDLDIDKIVQSTMQTPPDIGVAMLTQDIFGADRRPPLRALDKPALILAAGKSPLLDLQKEEAATIPGSQFVVIENAGHAVMVDQPARFDSVLAAFQSAGKTK